MDRSQIDELAETFLILMPLIQKQLFDSIGPEEMPPVQLPGTAGRALRLLREVRKARASELGKRLNIARPNMTTILDQLQGLGLIIREADETDRRVINVVITPQGAELCDAYTRIVSNKIRLLLKEIAPEELDALLLSMTKMKEILIKADAST